MGACSHAAYTWPQTKDGRTYVVCTSCGAEAAYNWEQMQVYDPGKPGK